MGLMTLSESSIDPEELESQQWGISSPAWKKREKGKRKKNRFLMHPLRRDIYTFICENPGTYYYDLVKAIPGSMATVSWHLHKLIESGLVDSFKFGGKRAYFPVGLRTMEEEKASIVLRNEIALKMFKTIGEGGYKFQREIGEEVGVQRDSVRWYSQRLAEADLIEEHIEGRKTYYQLTEFGWRFLEQQPQFSDEYINLLSQRLMEEKIRVEVVKRSPTHLEVRLCNNYRHEEIVVIDGKNWQLGEVGVTQETFVPQLALVDGETATT